MPQSFYDYVTTRMQRIGYSALVLTIIVCGAAIALLIVPMLRKSDHGLPRFADVLLLGYQVLVVVTITHMATSRFVIPRLRQRATAFWLLGGRLLIVLLIVVPFIAYAVVYNALFDGLR